MALLAVAIVRFAGRKQIRWLPAWGIAMVAVLSHLILDLTNVYGVRLALPFTGHWWHWDLTPIIDLAIWAVLLLGVAAPALGRLVGSEISVLHDRAVAFMDSADHARIYSELAPRRTAAFPAANPFVWTGIAELSNTYVEVPIDLRGAFHTDAAETFYKPERTAAVQAAMETFPFRRFLEFVQFPIWVIEPAPNLEHGTRVSLVDLRFGTPSAPGFVAVATVTDRNQVADTELTFGRPRLR
jgi:inner membrane protein